MGTSSKEFIAFLLEQLVDLPGLTTGRFFGGVAIKSGSTQFAMIMDGILYFSVDEQSRHEYELRGSRCFAYDTKNGRVEVRKYFEVPSELLEDQAQLMAFARTAIEAARNSSPNQKSRGRGQARA